MASSAFAPPLPPLRPLRPAACPPADRSRCPRRRAPTRWSLCTSTSSTPSSPTPSSRSSTRIYEPVTWGAIDHLASDLASQLHPSSTGPPPFDVILAVTRGGLVPATLLSERLSLRNVLAATVMFYSDDGERFFGLAEPRFLAFPPPSSLRGRRVLVVDDVWDSGRTMRAVLQRVASAQPETVCSAVLHFKPGSNTSGADKRPDYFAATAENWIVYPWEKVSVMGTDSSARSSGAGGNAGVAKGAAQPRVDEADASVQAEG